MLCLFSTKVVLKTKAFLLLCILCMKLKKNLLCVAFPSSQPLLLYLSLILIQRCAREQPLSWLSPSSLAKRQQPETLAPAVIHSQSGGRGAELSQALCVNGHTERGLGMSMHK